MKCFSFFHPEVRIDENSVMKAYEDQKKAQSWSFFDERLHMETVFSQRVNFVLLLFPVLVAAFCAMSGKTERLLIATAGVVVLMSFYLPLLRTYFKLDIVQKITYKIPMGELENNPIVFIHKHFSSLPKNRRLIDKSSYSTIMTGIAVMIIFMLLLAILTLCNVV